MNTTEVYPFASRDDLLRDNRGAVMVVGVFMAAFLVGALWYIIGIGDAILYKERMQDGADAVAYAAAVYHARGMNIIAMLNIIMAAILAVLVAFKLLQAINAIANVVFCAIAAWPFGGEWAIPFCTVTTELESPISKAVNIAQKLVDATLPVLSKTEVAIAVSMPWVAEAKGVYIASHYYKKPVNEGGIISISLVPFVPKERLGLPVQEDAYKFLCKKAGEDVGKLVFSPFGSLGNTIAGAVGSIVSWFPGYFCGDSGGSSSGGSSSGGGSATPGMDESSINDMAKQMCQTTYSKLKGDEKKDFDMKKCRKDTKKNIKKNMQSKNNGNKGGSGSTNSKTSKKVFWAAKNGNGYFQIWSVVVGDQKFPQQADKGVSIANWNKGNVTPKNVTWGKVAFAQAEFYYDQSGDWEKMKEDAMWNMRWRARLRRVRSPAPTVASMLLNDVIGAVIGKISPMVAAALGGGEVLGYVLGNWGGGKFEKMLGQIQQSGSSKFQGSYIKNPKLQSVGPIDIVH